MGSDHILLITQSRHSLPVLFKVGAQGRENNTFAMSKHAHHQCALDVLHHQMILMVVNAFAVPVPTLTCWAKSSN